MFKRNKEKKMNSQTSHLWKERNPKNGWRQNRITKRQYKQFLITPVHIKWYHIRPSWVDCPELSISIFPGSTIRRRGKAFAREWDRYVSQMDRCFSPILGRWIKLISSSLCVPKPESILHPLVRSQAPPSGSEVTVTDHQANLVCISSACKQNRPL